MADGRPRWVKETLDEVAEDGKAPGSSAGLDGRALSEDVVVFSGTSGLAPRAAPEDA
jgi:hypothetical protein